MFSDVPKAWHELEVDLNPPSTIFHHFLSFLHDSIGVMVLATITVERNNALEWQELWRFRHVEGGAWVVFVSILERWYVVVQVKLVGGD